MFGRLRTEASAMLAAYIVGVLLLVNPVTADTPSSKTESDFDRQAEMAKLLEIAKRGRAAVRPYDGTLDVTGHPAMGHAEAPLVMVEFGGYQCGYCRKHYFDAMPSIKSSYVDTGKLRYVFFDVALDPSHEQAAKAAEAAYCAHEQEGYWEYRGQLYRNSRNLTETSLLAHAESVGLDTAAFEACLQSGRHAEKPGQDRGLSRELKVRGTPSFFIGRPEGNGEQIMLVKRISGARSKDFFAKQLDPLYAQLARQNEVVSGVFDEDEWTGAAAVR